MYIPDDVVKILDLHLDNNLNFDVHISKLCKKAGNQICVSLDYVMFLTSQVRCYYIIVLFNAILTIVQLSGTSVVSITDIKLKISKKRNYGLSQLTSTTLPINYYSMIVINIHCM